MDYKRYTATLAGAALAVALSTLLIPMAGIAVATPVGTITELTCAGTGTCLGKLTLSTKSRGKGKRKRLTTTTIGTATFSIPAGKTITVNLKLDAAGRALFKAHHGHLTASLTILKSLPVPPQTYTESVQLARPKNTSVKKPR